MNKYFSIFKTSLKQESKTYINTINSVISLYVMIYIFYELWKFIYGGGGGGTLINGYSIENMIWYLIVAELLLYCINTKGVTADFGDDIKSGRIAYKLNKPYNYFLYQIFFQAGKFIYNLAIMFPAGLVLGIILVGIPANFSILYGLPIIFSLIMAIFLSCLMYGIIGLLCFWLEETEPFSWIIQKFQMLLGLFFPPEFFPNWLQPIINYSPIYATMSGPAKLIANFSWQEFLNVSISQIAYSILFFIVGYAIYKIGTKKVNLYGG
ncbi:MAG: hypothetical protein IJA69_04335 [Clostridia bacterium]|nr:hypothetical protein [Clostridia bacterium]